MRRRRNCEKKKEENRRKLPVTFVLAGRYCRRLKPGCVALLLFFFIRSKFESAVHRKSQLSWQWKTLCGQGTITIKRKKGKGNCMAGKHHLPLAKRKRELYAKQKKKATASLHRFQLMLLCARMFLNTGTQSNWRPKGKLPAWQWSGGCYGTVQQR